jgi:hypothetical protein
VADEGGRMIRFLKIWVVVVSLIVLGLAVVSSISYLMLHHPPFGIGLMLLVISLGISLIVKQTYDDIDGE